jgi:hypothetical protein
VNKVVSNNPKVTAVMVTGHDPKRRPLARYTAIRFSNQTYENASLLIVNQGKTKLLSTPIFRVREVMADPALILGDLRNLAWEYADTDLMMCWDDDDVHGANRISVQVAEFLTKRTPIMLRTEIYVHVRDGTTLVRSRRPGFENSLLWPRSCTSRYPSLRCKEDSGFRDQLEQEFGTRVVDNDSLEYLRLYHGRNVWDDKHFFNVLYNDVIRKVNEQEQTYINDVVSVIRNVV